MRNKLLGVLGVGIMALGLALTAHGSTITLDIFNAPDPPLPGLSGELSTDGSDLLLEVTAIPMALSGNNAYIAALFYTGDADPEGFAGPWDDAYLLLDNFFSTGPGQPAWGIGSGSSHPWSNQGALPTGVSMTYSVDGDNQVWSMTVPFDAIGLSPGDSFSYMVQARYQDLDSNSLTLNQSHGSAGFNPLYFSENFQAVQTPSGDMPPDVIPEPATMTLLGLGLGGLAVRRYRSKRKG